MSVYGISQNNSQKAKKAFLEKNYQLTIEEINLIKNSEVNFDSLLYLKAYSHIKLNQLKEAEKTITHLLQINPNYYEAFFLKGLLAVTNENYFDAISQFNKVIKQNPQHEKALYNNALAKGLLEDYKGAIQELNACIVVNPNYSLAYYNRGYWQELLEEYDKSILDYSKAIEIDKRFTEAYIALAYVYNQKGDNISACQTLTKAKEEGIESANDLLENFCK
jgi:tetratricopeptide (TPR) repeat protein